MKKLTLSICLLLLAGNAKCEVDKQQNTRIYDNKGNFQGRVIGTPDNTRIYDNKGNFQGRIIQSPDGEDSRIYKMEDGVLKYKSRVIK